MSGICFRSSSSGTIPSSPIRSKNCSGIPTHRFVGKRSVPSACSGPTATARNSSPSRPMKMKGSVLPRSSCSCPASTPFRFPCGLLFCRKKGSWIARSVSAEAVFQAVRATCGDEAVPYWQGLMTEWAWTNRRKKEELAVLGAETLGKLATPAAIAALSLGAQKGSAAVRQACAAALSQAQRLQRGIPVHRHITLGRDDRDGTPSHSLCETQPATTRSNRS